MTSIGSELGNKASRQTQVYCCVLGPFRAQTRYDVRLANRRAPAGVWFLLGFRMHPLLVQNGPQVFQGPVIILADFFFLIPFIT